jgi:hypothetical protein
MNVVSCIPTSTFTYWHSLASRVGPRLTVPSPAFPRFPANREKKREPTSGLEPLTCSSYECAVRRCRDLQTVAEPA